MDDDDAILAGPALRVEEIDVGPVEIRRRAPRKVPDSGHFLACLIGDPGKRDTGISAEWVPAEPPERPMLVGWAAAMWAIRKPTQELQLEWQGAHGGERHEYTRDPVAFVRYSFLKVWLMDLAPDMPDWVNGQESDAMTALRLFEMTALSPVEGSATTMEAALKAHSQLPMRVVRLPWGTLDFAVSSDYPSTFMLSRLGARIESTDLLPDMPSSSLLKVWRRRLQGDGHGARVADARTPTGSYDDVVLDQPAKSEHLTGAQGRVIGGFQHRTGLRQQQNAMDPLHIITAIGFSRFLRDQQHFSEALQAAQDYDRPDLDGALRERSDDPHRSSLDLAFRRMDLVDCLLHRREFQADHIHDNLVAVNVYSDASPNSGEELQGMVIDVFRKNSEPTRITLPGSTLAYSHFDATSKAIALLHGFWLIAGPFYAVLKYVLSKVISVTTDFGTERKTVTMLDCVLAYCLWMGGVDITRCKDVVVRDSRWLPNALRLSGWSHAIGNAVKTVAESVPQWPRYLRDVRLLVAFFSGTLLGGSGVSER